VEENKMRCLLIDDDEIFLSLMEVYVNEHPDLELVQSCSSATDAMNVVEDQPIDLILLDIEMPDITGIELVKSANLIPQVIFVTAHAGYAAEAFEYDVTDYIVKPINQNRFNMAIDRAINIFKYQELVAEQEYLFFKVGSDLVKILADNIIKVEAFGDYIKLFEGDNRHVILGTLNNMQNTLNSDKFMRIHRRYIVRLDAISNVKGQEIELENGQTALISRNKKSELLVKLKNGL